jgi:type IV fimbrial biogenesis protein FimT
MNGRIYLTGGSVQAAVPLCLSLYYKYLLHNGQGSALLMITSRGNWINSSYRTRTGSKGFTLLELMIVMVIVAIGVALAVPSYQDTLQKRRLTSAAESIASVLAQAQGEAIKRNETVAVSIRRTDDSIWCVGAKIKASSDDHCDCRKDEVADASDPLHCDFDPDDVAGTQQLINQDGFESFAVLTAKNKTLENDIYFYFDPVRGIKVDDDGAADAAEHEITLSSLNGNWSLRVDTSVTGRIRICSPDSTKKVPGFPSCPVSVVIPPPPPPPAPAP